MEVTIPCFFLKFGFQLVFYLPFPMFLQKGVLFMSSVFLFASGDFGKLKLLLEGDSLSQEAFARVGYYLREAKGFGLEGYAVYMKGVISEGQRKKLFELPSCKELSSEEAKKVADVIEAEENQAAAGFGSMFG